MTMNYDELWRSYQELIKLFPHYEEPDSDIERGGMIYGNRIAAKAANVALQALTSFMDGSITEDQFRTLARIERSCDRYYVHALEALRMANIREIRKNKPELDSLYK